MYVWSKRLGFLKKFVLLGLFFFFRLPEAYGANNQVRTSIADIFGAGRGITIAPLVYTQSDIVSKGLSYRIVQDRRSSAVFSRLIASRFSFVRLPVNPDPLAQAPSARAIPLRQILSVVKQAQSYGLGVIVDVHPWSPTNTGMCSVLIDTKRRQYLADAEGDLGRLLRGQSRVALELFNEPPSCSADSDYNWQSFLNVLYKKVRDNAPKLPVVVTGLNGYIDNLKKLDISAMVKDENVIYTFHFYEPFIFTHQETYSGGVALRAVPYPPRFSYQNKLAEFGNRISKVDMATKPWLIAQLYKYLASSQNDQMIAARIKSVRDWASANKIPTNRVWLGEFGTTITEGENGEAVFQDQIHWLRTVRSEAERSGFPWSYWLYPNVSSINYDKKNQFLKKQALVALGLLEK